VSGVCGDDAQPYACATQRFARDFLLPQSRASSVPSCPECPPNTTLPYDHCKSHSEAVDLDVLEMRARGLPECKAADPPGSRPCIDPLSHLNRSRAFTSRSECHTYRGPAVLNTAHLYARFGAVASDVWDVCAHGRPDPEALGGGMLDACLRHLYGDANVAPPASVASFPGVLSFDQRPFAAAGTNLNSWGTLYVPSGCRGGGGPPCALQVWFHGCGTYPPELFVQYPTAEANRIVMLVPDAAEDWTADGHGSWREGSEPRASCNAGTAGAGNCGEVARSCWDGYGQLAPGYMLQDAPHMATVWAMVAHLSRLDCVGCEPQQPVGLYGVALLSLGLGALLVGLCCLCCLGRCTKRRYARRRRAVPMAAAGAAGAAEGLQLADARSGGEALSPSEVEQSAAAPASAARQRRTSRMEAAGTAKLLEACPSDAGYEDDAESTGGEGRTKR
jgi:hypothetical protein